MVREACTFKESDFLVAVVEESSREIAGMILSGRICCAPVPCAGIPCSNSHGWSGVVSFCFRGELIIVEIKQCSANTGAP